MNKKCQVFTPFDNVVELLDRVGYLSNLYGKKVIENACGDGNILVVIAERYIKDCLSVDMNLDQIKSGLESDIYGAEIDKKHYYKCILNLNSIARKYDILNVKWNILNVDILKAELSIKFDYVIGNPPYITYRELDEETRKYLRDNYDVCSEGQFDYCYAFIEASLKCLNETGRLSYLIPSSIFKNVFAQKLRDYMLPYLCKIYDYTTEKLFNTVITSSAIIILDKADLKDKIEYFDIANNISHNAVKSALRKKWVFTRYKNRKATKKATKKARFGDYFTASNSVATLLNKVFIIDKFDETSDYIITNNYKIEKKILKIAASSKCLNYGRKEWIIYPYYYEDNRLIRYTEEEFISKFPCTTSYLMNHRIDLNKRKSDKSVQWFEYGRTQALAHLNQKKLVTSAIITKKVKVYELSEEYIPYSGIYITTKGTLPLSKAKEILESDDFFKYVQAIGVNASGNSMRILTKDINNFLFDLK